MSFFEKINKNNIPQHVAITMDGNGRWAKNKGLDRTEGHKEGIVSVRTVIEAAADTGISYVTLYTFSTENWNRPVEEVNILMALMVGAISRETPDLIKNNIRLKTIGDVSKLPSTTLDALNKCIEDTSVCTGLTLILALSYSSRWEITDAVKRIVSDAEANKLAGITEDTIANYLCTKEFPDPDLMIRTGGEKRISNFLLWQAAYSELYFTNVLWPDFRKEEFWEAIVDYQNRERRFGKTSEQL